MAFVKELLQVEPENRIGFGSTRDLKNHPLFLDDAKIIDWNLLQDMPAPPLAGQGQRTGLQRLQRPLLLLQRLIGTGTVSPGQRGNGRRRVVL